MTVNNFDIAIEQTVKFLVDIIKTSNKNPPAIIQNIHKNMIERGEKPKPYEGISESDIELFSDIMHSKLKEYLTFFDEANLIIDYQPMFLFHDILEASDIKNVEGFIQKSGFPFKMKIQIKKEAVRLFLQGEELPVLWIADL